MKKSILVVEDEKNILDLLNLILTSDYDLFFANNGKEALEVLETEKPDLVLMDLMMEVMDGMSALKAIKSNEKTKDLKVVVLSAKCQKKDMEDAEKNGAVGFITKPFDPNQLLENVKKVIEN